MLIFFIFSILYTQISSQQTKLFEQSTSNLFARKSSPNTFFISDGTTSVQHNFETNEVTNIDWTSEINNFSNVYPSVSYNSNDELLYALFYNTTISLYCWDFINNSKKEVTMLNNILKEILSSESIDSNTFIIAFITNSNSFSIAAYDCSTSTLNEVNIQTNNNYLSVGLLTKNSLDKIILVAGYKNANNEVLFSLYFIKFESGQLEGNLIMNTTPYGSIDRIFQIRLMELNEFLVICFSSLESGTNSPFPVDCFHGKLDKANQNFRQITTPFQVINNCKYDDIKNNPFSMAYLNAETLIVGCLSDFSFSLITPNDEGFVPSLFSFSISDLEHDEFHYLINNVIYHISIAKDQNGNVACNAEQISFNVNEPNISNSYERTNHNAYYFDSKSHQICNANCFACEDGPNCIGCKKGSAPLSDNNLECKLITEMVSEYLYDEVNNVFQKCRESFFYYDEDNQFICSKCDDGKFLSIDGISCDNSCIITEQYFYGRNCYTECPDNTIKYEQTKGCYKYCKTINKHKYEEECVDACPGSSKSNDNGKESICENFIPPASQGSEPVEMDISLNEINTILQDNLVQLASQQSNVKGDGFILQVFTTDNKINDNPGVSSIDLGECEDILRSSYSIPQNESLIISKYDIDQKGAITNKVEYSVYRADGTPLDLSKCDDIGVEISYPIVNKDGINFEKAAEFGSNGIDIYNNDDPFFVDYCISYSEGGSDMVRSDRLDDIYTDVPFCAEGCSYEGVNYTTSKAICKCGLPETNETENSKNNSESNSVGKFLLNIGNSLYEATNIKLFTCHKQAFEVKKYKNNVGFIFGAICLGIEIIMFSIFVFCFGVNKLIYKMFKPEVESSSAPPIKQRKALFSKTIQPKGKKHSITYEKSLRQLSMKINNNDNDENNKNGNVNSMNRTSLSVVPMTSRKEKDEDTSNATYERALQGEDQNCMKFFFILLFGKIEIIKIFFCRGEYELLVVCIAVYIFSLASDFFMNALLFSDDVISQKYNNNGEMSPFTQYLLSILSNVLSLILSSIMFKLTNYSFLFDFIKQQSNNEKHKYKLTQKIVGCVKIKLYAFFLILIPITGVYLYYLCIFCSVYSASQINWFTNSITSMFLSLILSLTMSVIIAMSRFIGLKCQSKKMYNISLYLNK